MPEKTTRKVPKYKTVKDGYTTETVWQVADGKTFSSKREAEEYERMLERNAFLQKAQKLKMITPPEIPEMGWAWYYAGTEDELDTIKTRLSVGDKYTKSEHIEFKTDEWYSQYVDDGGDLRASIITILSLTYLKKRISDFENAFSREEEKIR